jgi:ribonuclease Z
MKSFGIRVNLIAPGRVKAQHESKDGDENGYEWNVESDDADLHATNRAGMPEDITETAEWLIGAGFVTSAPICQVIW